MQLRGFGSKWDMREKEDCQKGEALCTKREDICLKLYCSFICHIREIEQHSHFVFSILNTSCTLSHFCDLSLSGNPGIYATLLLQVYICWTLSNGLACPRLYKMCDFLFSFQTHLFSSHLSCPPVAPLSSKSMLRILWNIT